ncbi:MAG: GHKL domain-containing protein [Dehalococcoidia bacterium]|nr:GHKL domain-containing protein [Dehalococcoidia bacterium]
MITSTQSEFDNTSINELSREQIASTISSLRGAGDLAQAISVCNEASRKFAEDYFYPKIAGDLYFQQGDYDSAADAFLDFLQKIPPTHPKSLDLFRDFTRRYSRLKGIWPPERLTGYAQRILVTIKSRTLPRSIALQCISLIEPDLPEHIELSDKENKLISQLQAGTSFKSLMTIVKEMEHTSPVQLKLILDRYILNRPRTAETQKFDAYCIAVYERMEDYAHALKIAEELLAINLESTALHSTLRICRKINNYERVDGLIKKYPRILKTDVFNVLYELVYYFYARHHFEQALTILEKMEGFYPGSIPIQTTIMNFYLNWGRSEDANRVQNRLLELYAAKNSTDTEKLYYIQDSQASVWSRVKELSSELEYQKQLAAVSDLTLGISHELGQPITNIRYTIQFYSRLFEKEEFIEREAVSKIFSSMLEETERMGRLIKRLAPLTSRKSVSETFDLMYCIDKRIQAEKARLQYIDVNVSPKTSVYLTGDPVKFEQLISNLLLNAIDAIKAHTRRQKNRIDIHVEEKETEIILTFADTGIGIARENRAKLFTPFFSTKSPGKGEGLGLFIVWNLLKMQGGKIRLDENYEGGTRFVILIPKPTRSIVDEQLDFID